jgi:hypothetical protein
VPTLWLYRITLSALGKDPPKVRRIRSRLDRFLQFLEKHLRFDLGIIQYAHIFSKRGGTIGEQYPPGTQEKYDSFQSRIPGGYCC